MGRRAMNPVSEASTVRIATAQAIPEVLRSLGVDPVGVLAEAGVDPGLFDDPDARISFARRGQLIRLCVARTGCSHFGLLVGAQGGLQSLGLLGLLMKYSPDVGSALSSLVRHLHLHGRGGATTLSVDRDLATLGFQVYLPECESNDQVGDASVAIMFNVLRALRGPYWRATEVLFAHRTPADVGPFHRLFDAPLRFNAEQHALVFKADELSHRLPAYDPALHRLLQQQVDALEARQAGDLPQQVRAVLRPALARGHTGVEEIAATFSMHSRTLNRRLRAFGTSFRALVDEARFENARQLLGDSAMDLRQIALLLGYADASAFTRAFRRWSGGTPAQWRASLDAPSVGEPSPGSVSPASTIRGGSR